MKKDFLVIVCLFVVLPFLQHLSAQHRYAGASLYPMRINDPEAVYLTPEHFNVAGDGVADDAPAIQDAIDLVQKKSGYGIVFIPEGTYRLGRTVYIYRGIRVIGYGKERPVFKLGDHTPGYQEGDHRYMVHFCQNPPGTEGYLQPGTWVTEDFQDGTFTTFFSGLQNINFEIGDGNPAAIAVRYHVAQVCVLGHIDFNIGNGRGGIQDLGNIVDNCTFTGGEFGIKTVNSAPGWQITVMDCSFKGQREVSLISNRAKMLVIRGRFEKTPVGIFLPGPGQLYVRDTWFEEIGKTAMQINNYVNEDLQVNFDDLGFSNVPYTVRFAGRVQGGSEKGVQYDFEAPAPVYKVKEFSQGLHIENPYGNALKRFFGIEIDQHPVETLGAFPEKDMPALPDQKTWVSITDLGAKGDGKTDCTEIFQKAIAERDAIYVPMGKYLISNSLILNSKTTIIGLHPSRTQFVLKDGTNGFHNADDLKSVIIAPEGGANGITGIGFDLGINPGAIGIKWMAGVHSFVNDGYFPWTTRGKRGKGNACSLWITNGGGGTFQNIWIVDPGTAVPFHVSNTSTPGRIYEVSVEHHKDIEVKLDHVENWSFYALQLEEDLGSEKANAMSIRDCSNLLFANLRSHRTSGVWEPCHAGIVVRNVRNITIKGNAFGAGVFPFDHTVFDEITGMAVTHQNFTKLVIR